MSDEAGRKPVSTRRRIVFRLIPFLAALLVLEIAARVFERATEEGVALVDASELRRRDGEMLVYVYGESTVWGFPVTEVGLVAQMQWLADRRGPGQRIRVLNLGVPSIDSGRLAEFFADTIGNGPDLAIVLCGHNEFLRPPAAAPPPGLLAHSAIARVAAGVAARSEMALDDATPAGLTKPFDRDAAAFRRREERYRENMASIVRTARERNVPLVLTSLASSLRDWPPVFRRLERTDGDASYEPAMERALAADAAGDAAALRSLIEPWVARAPDDAMVRFLRGRLRWSQGDAAGARDDFTFARDADPIPCRMTSALAASVKAVAAETETPLVDLADAVSGGELAGSDLLVDNCHPTPEGARRMALALLRAAERTGVLPAAAEDASPPVGEFLRAAGCVEGSPLRLRLLLEDGRYAMRRPLYHYPIAERHLRQAVAEFPSSWEAHANLATVLLLQRRTDEGRAALRRAEALHGGPLDLTDRVTLPYLESVLAASGGK